jgi:hypothetical protein
VVTCPKCSAELLIPVPELGSEVEARSPAPPAAKGRSEARPKALPEVTVPPESAGTATAALPAPRPALTPAYVDEIAAVLPPDLIDLRPEDLRVEAEFFESLTRQSQTAVVREPAPWPQVESVAPAFESENFAAPFPISTTAVPASAPSPPAPVVPSYLTETVDLAPPPYIPPPPVPKPAPAEAALVGTAIEIEHPSILPPGSEIRRVSEVVLPASVVVSWSLFALLGIGLSFVAGLLMGHFLWRAH